MNHQIFLSVADSAQHDLGNWLAYEVEEDIREQLLRDNVCERVVVRYADGVYAFEVAKEVLA